MFSYPPINKEDADKERYSLIPPGVYNFRVVEAKFGMSNTGQYRNPAKPSNPMIVLDLMVCGEDGKEHDLKDWLVATPKMAWKTIRFCESTGLMSEYETGKFNEDLCFAKEGRLRIGVQKGKPKDGGGNYPDKNCVEDYVGQSLEEKEKNAPPKPRSADELNDDIPF